MNNQSFTNDCYFCNKNVILKDCMTKSLYHKHNDTPDKLLELMDDLILYDQFPKSEKRLSKINKIYQIQYKQALNLCAQSEIIDQFIGQQQARNSLSQLLEYYKYRVYVPLFSQDKHNEERQVIYCYYYEKLKFYYNDVKRQLKMTIINSEDDIPSIKNSENVTESVTDQKKDQKNKSKKKTKAKPNNNNNILENLITEVQNKSTIQEYQTESKALEGLINFLGKNQKLKKIKALKTEDYLNINQFRDIKQKLSIATLPKNFRKHKKGLNIHSSSSNIHYTNQFTTFLKQKLNNNLTRARNSTSKLSNKIIATKQLDKPRKSSVSSTHIKIIDKYNSFKQSKPKENQQVARDITSNSKNYRVNRIKQQKNSAKYQPLMRYGSTPKINMNFDITKKIYKSMSSKSKKKLTSQEKEPRIKIINQIQMRESIKKTLTQTKNVVVKKSSLDFQRNNINFQIDKEDNIATLRKKKLQFLKIRAQNKKKHQ